MMESYEACVLDGWLNGGLEMLCLAWACGLYLKAELNHPTHVNVRFGSGSPALKR